MKITTQQIEKMDNLSNGGAISYLIYGENYGLQSYLCEKITTEFLKSSSNPVTTIDYSDSSQSHSATLNTESFNFDFIQEKKVIKIRSVNQKTLGDLKAVFLKKNLINPDVLIIVLAESLDTKSALRSLYESEDYLGSVACYQENQSDLVKFIKNELDLKKIKYAPDVPPLIYSLTDGSRLEILSEIEKISLISSSSETIIDAQIISDLIGDPGSYAIEKIIDNIGIGKTEIVIFDLENAINDDFNMFGFIRMSLIHFGKIRKIIENISRGSTPDEEIKNNRIFFKRADIYKRQLLTLDIKKVDNIIEKFVNLEDSLKNIPSDTVNNVASIYIAKICNYVSIA